MGDSLNQEKWKTSLLKAPDEQYFQIMRTYLGDVKTPFNKHELIRRLSALLRKPEVADRILSLIGTADARVLSAIILLGEPTMGTLFSLFEGTTGYLKLHYHVLNLEERMLVFRDESGKTARIRIHPLLEKRIIDEVADSRLVYHLSPTQPQQAHLSWPTDARIIATATYIAGTTTIMKSDGSLRKKNDRETKTLFHEDQTGTEYGGFRATMRALVLLGIFSEIDGALRLELKNWHSFCELSASERRAYLVSSGVTKKREAAAVLRSLEASLPPHVAIDEESFKRMYCSRAETGNRSVESIVHMLLSTGIFSRTPGGDLVQLIPPVATSSAAGKGGIEAVIQPTFELSVPHTISAEVAWFLPFVAELRAFDTVSRYEITRAACARGFDAGLTADTMIDLLNTLCANQVPSNIRTTLMLWEQEFHSIRMIHGTVVLVQESRRHLFDYDAEIQKLVQEKISPGVYLIESRNIVALRKHLRQAGVDPLPEVVSLDVSEASRDTPVVPLPSPEEAPSSTVNIETLFAEKTLQPRYVDRDAYRMEVESYPGIAELSKAQRGELDERVARKLILFPEQIRHLQPLTEVIEAKGFDYLGKVRLIERAIAGGNDLLEVIGMDEHGEMSGRTIKPDSLEQEGSELILIGRDVSGEETIRIRVRTIGMLRKRRGSMLG